jgi:hypothetical protein
MAQTDWQLCEELWGEVYGLNPAAFKAWCHNPAPRKPTCRRLQDGSVWVVEAFRGLELGRYDREEQAKVTLMGLNSLFSWLPSGQDR